MKSFGYYSSANSNRQSLISWSDYERLDVPLFVNCSGIISRRAGFTTYNPSGRRDYYLIYVVRGTLFIPIGEEEKEAPDGSVIIFPPHSKYKYTFRGSEDGLLYYWAHFTGGRVEKFLSDLNLHPLPLLVNIGYRERISEDFDRIFNAYVKDDAFRDAEIACTFGNILTSVAQNIAGADKKGKLSKSLTYIHLHYHEKIKVEQLAKIECLSVSSYIEVFRQAVGEPPMSYIVSLRLKNACTLLSTTNLPIGKVAETVGIPDVHFFSKIFKKAIGMSPSEYKKHSRTTI